MCISYCVTLMFASLMSFGTCHFLLDEGGELLGVLDTASTPNRRTSSSRPIGERLDGVGVQLRPTAAHAAGTDAHQFSATAAPASQGFMSAGGQLVGR